MIQGHKVAAVIAAAGNSSRMGFDKLFYKIEGKEVLWHAVQALARHPAVDSIVVVAGDNLPEVKALLDGTAKLDRVIRGGATRTESVRLGVKAARGDLVAIHDGARPFVTPEIIDEALETALEMGAAAPAIAVKDTIKVAENGLVRATPTREKLYAVQTPQVFHRALYLAAVKAAGEDAHFTDDCALLEAYGSEVRLTEGSAANIKITTREDLTAYAPAPALPRVGHGYDVHRFAPGRVLMLGGVPIPWWQGLLGHSDADVLLHAIMDALLGAAALGDIGSLFPPSEEAYKDADSLRLLEQVKARLEQAGFTPAQLDATVVCEAPRLAPHIDKMRQNIADTLALPVSAVSVKATTEEGLGFTGRGEGIAAHCVAVLSPR